MGRYYHDERRAHEPHYAPSLETFYKTDEGWYYWFCMPGCLPDGDEMGPFETEEEALEHARLDLEPDEEPDDSMDGDFDSAMRSAGLGTDEDYG